MDPNWAEVALAITGIITALTAVLGAFFVVIQLRAVERATRAATYERFAAQSYDVIRFLAHFTVLRRAPSRRAVPRPSEALPCFAFLRFQ